MTAIILGIGVAVFIVYTVFHISYILSLKRASEQMVVFFQNTEVNLNAALIELRDTLDNLKKITGNVNAVSDDVKQISHTVANVEKSVRVLYAYMTMGLGPAAGANIAGLKAGISTGVKNLVKSLKQRRRVHHERRTWS